MHGPIIKLFTQRVFMSSHLQRQPFWYPLGRRQQNLQWCWPSHSRRLGNLNRKPTCQIFTLTVCRPKLFISWLPYSHRANQNVSFRILNRLCYHSRGHKSYDYAERSGAVLEPIFKGTRRFGAKTLSEQKLSEHKGMTICTPRRCSYGKWSYGNEQLSNHGNKLVATQHKWSIIVVKSCEMFAYSASAFCLSH